METKQHSVVLFNHVPHEILYEILKNVKCPQAYYNLAVTSLCLRNVCLDPLIMKIKRKTLRVTIISNDMDKIIQCKILPNGLQDGKEKHYYHDGSICKSIPWRNGIKDGMEKIYRYSEVNPWIIRYWINDILIETEQWTKLGPGYILYTKYSERTIENGPHITRLLDNNNNGIESHWNTINGRLTRRIQIADGVAIKDKSYSV